MHDKPKYPWRLATNERYREVVTTLITLSTASFLLPVFFAREFFGVDAKTPLKDIASWPLYSSWALLGFAIFAGITFHYLSAKWARMAWGQEAGVLGVPASERFAERALEVFFWATVLSFMSGLGFILAFLFGYGGHRGTC